MQGWVLLESRFPEDAEHQRCDVQQGEGPYAQKQGFSWGLLREDRGQRGR